MAKTAEGKRNARPSRPFTGYIGLCTMPCAVLCWCTRSRPWQHFLPTDVCSIGMRLAEHTRDGWGVKAAEVAAQGFRLHNRVSWMVKHGDGGAHRFRLASWCPR